MKIEEELLGIVKKYETVIIYGFKDIGTCVLDYLINFETDIKLSNYCGRVKYFAHSEPSNNDHEKKGIPIRTIDQLTDYADESLVIIATQEQHHDVIRKKLDKYGFENRLFISHEIYIQLKRIVNNYRTSVDNLVRQYSFMHEYKLDRLKKKVKDGKKIKVFFLTQRAAAFGAASVYRAMEESSYFEPYIMCFSKRDKWSDQYLEYTKEDIEFFEERNFCTINAYDENGISKDLTLLNPDIIFWDSPNLYGPANNSSFRLDQLNWKFLTCYIPYGLLMVDSFYYHYNNINIRTCWKYFLDTDSSYMRALMDAEFNGLNIVKAGYPKFDDYLKTNNYPLPVKLDNGKRTVIYAPHWSLDIENNFATFDIYKDYFLNLAKEHTECNFVFKPHPELVHRIAACYRLGKINFSKEDFENYMDEWNLLPNGMCILQGDYIGIFAKSDCMITDCGSFIGEYLPSMNPCIYLFNPRKKHQLDSYTPLAKKILDTYYIVNSSEELNAIVDKVIFKGIDEKRTKREYLKNTELANIGHAGKFICNYLEQELTDF